MPLYNLDPNKKILIFNIFKFEFNIHFLIIILIIVLYPFISHGQGNEKIKFNHITVEDGLSHHEVSFILQDSQGFIWFGTKYGLNRFDGIDIKVFTHDPENY